MRREIAGACMCLMVLAGAAQAQETPPREAVLFDFEAGADGWAGNPWKGGKCLYAVVGNARFGKQALHGWYEGTPKKDGGTIIGPCFAPDAAWRKGEWGSISLWLKGDGSPSSIGLILEEDAKEHPNFTRQLPLDNKDWQRFSFPFRSFWNRGKRKLTPAGLKRLYFQGTPSQSFVVDRIALEAPHRVVPVERIGPAAELPFETPSVLEYASGQYGIRLIPIPKGPESSADATVSLATDDGEKAEKTLKVPLDATCDETTVPLTVALRKDTTVRLAVAVKGASGKSYSAAFQFPAFVRVNLPDKPYLAICPLPTEMKPSEGFFQIVPGVRIVVEGAPGEEAGYCVDLLKSQLKKWHNRVLESADGGARENAILLKIEDVGLPPEGYLLRVTPTGAEIRGKEWRCVYYGIQTLLQAIADSTESPSAPRVKCVEVRDWPDLPMRAARIGLPTEKWGYPNDPEAKVEDFLDFLDNTMARQKFNTLVLEFGHGCRFACAPKIGAKHAWGREEQEKIKEFCKRRFIEIIPLTNSMGHTGWLLLGYPELRWHDDINMLCTCNPESFRIMASIYDELIEVFHPRIYHIGMDEVRWVGNPKKPNPPPCGCDSVPTWEQYGRWVKKLHDHLTSKGVRTMMWGDMVLPEHNGGPPFFTERAIAQVPRDVIVANWSSSIAPLSDFFFKKECGFADVVESNSYGVNVERSPYVMGNMFGMWSKAPWVSQHDAPGSQEFCYLALIQAGEFSWNVNRADKDVCKRYDTDYLKSREPSALKGLALLPEPNGAKETAPIDLAPAANADLADAPGRDVSVSGVGFRLLPGGKCIRLAQGESKSIAFGGKAASLYFLHTEQLPDDPEKRKTFLEGWKKIENLWGIPIGSYEMVYEDGSVEKMAVTHSWNILPRRMVRTLPYAYRVFGSLRLPGDGPDESNALYAAQWVNPHPEKGLKEVRMCVTAEPTIFLCAVTARAVAQANPGDR